MSDKPWLKFYDPHVPPSLEYPQSDVLTLLREQAAESPEREAVSFLGRRLSYRELMGHIQALAGALAARGIGPGDKVVLLMANCPQFVISFYALMTLGAVAVMGPARFFLSLFSYTYIIF